MNWQNLYLFFVCFLTFLFDTTTVLLLVDLIGYPFAFINDFRISSNCDLYEFFSIINSFVFVTKYEGETSKENIFNSCNFSFKAGTYQSEMKITDNNHPFIYKRSDCSC